MKQSKISMWRRTVIVIMVIMIAFFIPNISKARILIDSAHAGYVIWRFEKEVLRSTRVGQYYEGLVFKHASEVGDLLSRDPDAAEKFVTLLEAFIPLLEKYMNGQGDSAIITAEAMNSLKEALDGFDMTGSPSFQQDIQKEYERFPLDSFVGMSMNDAYNYVLENFTGLDNPMIVEGTEGKWAYYISNRVYFEYPYNWYVQEMEINEEDRTQIIIIPSSTNPAQWAEDWMVLGVTTNVQSEEAVSGNFSFNTTGYEFLWRKDYQTGDMRGLEYGVKNQVYASIITELYNSKQMMFVDLGVIVLDPFGIHFDSSQEVVEERYEYYFHLVNSIKIMQP